MNRFRHALASRWTEIDGVRVHARISTDAGLEGAPPVVLVHGLGVSSRYMIPLARSLAPHTPVYAPDLPGFGRSAKPPYVLNMDELADALTAWMDTWRLDRPVLVGNSFGCQIITTLALRHPGRIQRAVLVGPSVDPANRSMHQQVRRLLYDALREPPSLLPIVMYDYLSAGPVRIWQTFRYLLDDPIRKKLPRMQLPTLVVRGGRDPVVPQRWAEEIVSLLPRGRLVVIEEATHAVNYNAADALACEILAFLADKRPPRDRS